MTLSVRAPHGNQIQVMWYKRRKEEAGQSPSQPPQTYCSWPNLPPTTHPHSWTQPQHADRRKGYLVMVGIQNLLHAEIRHFSQLHQGLFKSRQLYRDHETCVTQSCYGCTEIMKPVSHKALTTPHRSWKLCHTKHTQLHRDHETCVTQSPYNST